jgi:hypothetical protein
MVWSWLFVKISDKIQALEFYTLILRIQNLPVNFFQIFLLIIVDTTFRICIIQSFCILKAAGVWQFCFEHMSIKFSFSVDEN